MSSTLEELQAKAAQLSPEERARLALALIESLEPVDEGNLEETWRLEAEARLAQLERGQVKAIPAEEVFANVRRRLG